jgi:DNA modification methylase
MSDVQGQNASPGVGRCEGWAYPGNRLPTFAGTHEATGHTAAFPVGLPAFFIKAYSDEGDNIYEPFCGSGSTLVAAEQEGRKGFGVELSPGYCGIILERLARMGLEPKLID